MRIRAWGNSQCNGKYVRHLREARLFQRSVHYCTSGWGIGCGYNEHNGHKPVHQFSLEQKTGRFDILNDVSYLCGEGLHTNFNLLTL